MTNQAWPDIVAAYREGKTLAYPTEGVWGLGCDPYSEKAVHTLLALKKRPISCGLIVIAADWSACADWVDTEAMAVSTAERFPSWPVAETWVFPATDRAPPWIRGDHNTVAIRVTAHPVAAALAKHCGLLCSTSANLSGTPAITDESVLRVQSFAEHCVIVSGKVGALSTATPMFDALTGRRLR